MDKETLSNYGWIVICVLVLAVMIALATPFGTFVADAVKSTTQGLFDVNQSALNSTGLINIDNQEFDVPDMNHGAENGGNGSETPVVPENPTEPETPNETAIFYDVKYYNAELDRSIIFKADGTGVYVKSPYSDHITYTLDGRTVTTGNHRVLNGEFSVDGYTYTCEHGVFIYTPLITFTIDGIEYQAEKGMTFTQWAISDYNTSTIATMYTLTDVHIVYKDAYSSSKRLKDPTIEGSWVRHGYDVIVENRGYLWVD